MLADASIARDPAWSDLGAQFCLALAFGLLLSMGFVAKAPLGRFFFRLMGGTALASLLASIALPAIAGGIAWSEASILLTALAAACFPLYARSGHGRAFAAGLVATLAIVGAALALTLQRTLGLSHSPALPVALLSALATGATAGSVGLAMVLGHWYLTVPKLSVDHLERANRLCIGAMLASLACLALTCVVFEEELAAGRAPLFSAWGMLQVGTRVAFGIALPLLFAWMTASSLRHRNTRSATGILYASTVLVLIGAALSMTLQNTYGVPL